MDREQRENKARSLAFRYLTYRPRTTGELRDYLLSKDFETGIIKSVLAEMQRYGYIDDEKYAENYIAIRKERGYGSLRIKLELINKGIDSDLVESKIAEQEDSDSEIKQIESIINKRITEDVKPDQRWLTKQASFLQRRGFKDHQIITVLNRYGLSD